MRNPGKEGFFVASDLNGFYNRRNGPAGEQLPNEKEAR
jgi:hypothetical protein